MKTKLAMLFFAVLMAVAVNAADMISQVRMLSMLDVPKTREAQAAFDGLKPEALEFGLGDAVLIGAVEYQALGEPNTRVTIKWHSVGMNNIGGQASQPLAKPLISQFTVDTKRVDPNTLLSVRGDLDQVAEAFLALKNRLAKNTPRDLVSKKETIKETNNTEKANANELSPSGSSSGRGGNLSNAPYSSSSNQNKIQTDMVVITWEDCAPRIDRAGGFVYPQARKIEKGQTSGRLMGTGSCEDHGDAAAIQTVFGGDCTDMVDVNQKKVFQQYRQFATLAGKQIDVALCTVDFAKFYPIVGNPSTCGYRHDFVNGVSVAQEQLEYTDSTGTIKTVRVCGDSAQSYTQYKTENSCTPTVDGPNSIVIINNRVAFKDSNAAEQYATACTPDSSKQFVISQAFCSPKYEHDFVNHVSYYVTSTYYVDASNNTHSLSTCTRSASNSFPHIFQTTGCSVTNDDANLMTRWNKLTQINTPTDGVLTIAPCAEVGSPTPYAYLGEVAGTTQNVSVAIVSNMSPVNYSYTMPTIRQIFPALNYSLGVSTYLIQTSASPTFFGCVGGGGVSYSRSFSKLSSNNPDDAIGASSGGYMYDCPDSMSDPTGQFMNLSYSGYAKPFYKKYLRGDGSAFTDSVVNRNEVSVSFTAN